MGSQGRGRMFAALAGLALIVGASFVAVTPADAKPDVNDVQARVDELNRQAEQAGENYDAAQLRLAALNVELKNLRADQASQDKVLATAREQLRQSLLQSAEGSNLSAVGEVILSDDPAHFLGKLSTMSSFQDLQTSLYDAYVLQARALDLRRKATQDRLDEVAATKRSLADSKREIATNLAKAKVLLSRLQASERLAILSRGDMRLPANIPAEGRAAAALGYATAQLGDAYVWGAAGPNAFDCSGLTMMAWAAAGVALPHSSRAQFNSGPHIAAGDLRPGDLVFYYSPISHVGLYIGNGMVLHAARPGEGVKVSGLYSMPYAGAVRPG